MEKYDYLIDKSYKVTMDYQKILEVISKEYQHILESNLVGIYVHGSIAFNCFNWEKSDIDFLVVVRTDLSHDVKRQLCEILIGLWNESPPKGLEMSVVKQEYCTNFKYPTPFELHMSSGCIDWYRSNPEDFCEKMNGTDKDLAAHFTVIKSVGITLFGLPIEEVFGEVPKKDYIESLKYDIEEARTEILKNPMYITLNLCRVLAYVRDGLILSKEQGGEWGVFNISEQYTRIISKALNCYQTNEVMVVEDENEAMSYCDYLLKQIFS